VTDTREIPAAPALVVRLADAATVLLLFTAVWILATGGTRFLLSDVVISFRSPLLFLYAAVAVQIVRHLLLPSPSAWSRLDGWWARLMARDAVAATVRPFIATRLAVFLAGFFAVIAFGLSPTPGFVLSRDPLANLPARFDAGWYGDIALDGYHWDYQFQRQRNIAFFPALPMLMRPVGAVLGATDRTVPRERRMLRMLWGGVVVSLIAFFGALSYLVRVGEDLIGPERAATAALLLAAYPFSFFYSAPYTESLFLLGATGAFYYFRREQWIASSLLGMLAGLSRPNGCFLSVPLGILALQHAWRVARERGGTIDTVSARAGAVRLLVAGMPGIGMLVFTAYLYGLTGVWFAWMRSHEAWGRTYHGIEPFVTAFGWLRDEPLIQVVTNIPFNTLNTLGLLFAVALLVPVFRRLGLAWGVFVVVNIALPLFAGGVLSMGRLTSTLFPLFLALAAILPPRSVPSWAAAFGVMQGLGAALFFTWRELF
jgi:hypothetical protein